MYSYIQGGRRDWKSDYQFGFCVCLLPRSTNAESIFQWPLTGEDRQTHADSLNWLARNVKPVDSKGCMQVSVLTTYTNPDPGTEYEYAERMRSDAHNVHDTHLLISVLNVIRRRVTDIQEEKKKQKEASNMATP